MILNRFSNISSLQFFQLFRFVILVLISILFAKSTLSIAEIGIYEKLIFLSGAISFFWVNGLTQALLPMQKSSPGQGIRSNQLFNAFVLSFSISLVVTIIVIAFEKNIAHFLLGLESIPFKRQFLLYFFFATPAFLVEYVYLLNDKPKSIIIYGIISFTLQLLLVCGPLYLGYQFEYSLWGLSASAVIRFAWLLVALYKYSVFSLSLKFIRDHARLSLPLIAGAFISGAIPYIDGLIISANFDDVTFAIYRYGARELPLLLMANAFSYAMVPELAKKGSITPVLSELKNKSKKLIWFLFPVSALLMIFSQFIFREVFNPDFLPGAAVFNIFLLLVITRLVFPQTILLASMKTKLLLSVSAFEFIIKVILSLWLVIPLGIIGVALATLLSFFVEKVILIFIVYKKLSIRPSVYIPYKIYFVWSVVLLFVYLMVEGGVL